MLASTTAHVHAKSDTAKGREVRAENLACISYRLKRMILQSAIGREVAGLEREVVERNLENKGLQSALQVDLV